MTNRPVIVIAGNYDQYRDFLRENNLSPSEYRYADRPENIIGKRGCLYILAGEYYLNPLYDKGQALFEAYGLKEIKL